MGDLPLPKNVDADALRRVENSMQLLGALVDQGVHSVNRFWDWLLLCFEYEGGGLTYVTSVRRARDVAFVARRQGERLRDNVPSPGVTVTFVPRDGRPRADALTEQQVADLFEGMTLLGKLVDASLPPGWGYALMAFARHSDQIHYRASADRPNMATALLEFAERLESGDVRGPGIVGRAH